MDALNETFESCICHIDKYDSKTIVFISIGKLFG